MEVKDYVRDTTLAIFRGIQEANAELNKQYSDPTVIGVGAINPVFHDFGETDKDRISNIDFDIATTISTAVSGSTGGKIEVASVARIGADGNASRGDETISRVKFSIAVVLPTRRIVG